jgi:hypothetical protein
MLAVLKVLKTFKKIVDKLLVKCYYNICPTTKLINLCGYEPDELPTAPLRDIK